MNFYANYSITHHAEIIAASLLRVLMILLSRNGLNSVSAHVVKGKKCSNLHKICCFYPIPAKFGTRANNIEEYQVARQELTKPGICACRRRRKFKTRIESVVFIRFLGNLVLMLIILRSFQY